VIEASPKRIVTVSSLSRIPKGLRRLEPLADASSDTLGKIQEANAYLSGIEKKCSETGWENVQILVRPIKKNEIGFLADILEMNYYDRVPLADGRMVSNEKMIAPKEIFEARFDLWPFGFFLSVLIDKTTGKEIGPVGYITGYPLDYDIDNPYPTRKEATGDNVGKGTFNPKGNAFYVFSTCGFVGEIGVGRALAEATVLHAALDRREFRIAGLRNMLARKIMLKLGVNEETAIHLAANLRKPDGELEDFYLRLYERIGFVPIPKSYIKKDYYPEDDNSLGSAVLLYLPLREKTRLRFVGVNKIVLDTDSKNLKIKDSVLPIYDGSIPKLLAEQLPRFAGNVEGKKVLDLGTGSGIFAISAALYGASEVVGVDINPRAIEMAKENAARAGVSIDFRQGSYFNVLREGEKFDVIISNPPFVPNPQTTNVATHTDGGRDGTLHARHILDGSFERLAEGGKLILYMLSLKKGETSLIEERIKESMLGKECRTVMYQCHSEDYPINDFLKEYEGCPGFEEWSKGLLAAGVTGLQRYLIVMERIGKDAPEAGKIETRLEGEGLLGKCWSKTQNTELFTGWIETA